MPAAGRRSILFFLLAMPLLLLGWQWVALLINGFSADLGANPVEKTIRDLGLWGLRILLLALAVTPAITLLKKRWPAVRQLAVHRRMIGLFAFAYILLHLSIYFWLDQDLSLRALWADVLKRWYITLGMAGFVVLLALAVTSTIGWQRRLKRGWKRLHRLVYAAAILGVLHFLFLVKARDPEPVIYGGILAALLLARLPLATWKHHLVPARNA